MKRWKADGETCIKTKLVYRCNAEVLAPTGRWVTFVTHPSFERDEEDAYELFAEVIGGEATQWVEAWGSFTVAAVGDAGDTAITQNLRKMKCRKGKRLPKNW
jgi:hypothetical protein